ncbi:MAG: hypothetical protein AB3N14_02695 [Flavobacteriaceae bacterium]
MGKEIWQFEHTVACNTDKSFAWAFWTDVRNWERLEGNAVEWIRLNGPFEKGTSGETKSQGQEPHSWRITALEPEQSATIDITLDGAVFSNIILMDTIAPKSTKITQRLSLSGDKAASFVNGMKMFETTAPQGLKKLAEAIEAASKS